MKQLQIGFISSAEIADWFGINYTSYRKSKAKKKYLALLEDYAEYEVIRGGIEITEIYMDTYNKDFQRQMTIDYIEEVLSKDNGLSTCAGMARKFQHNKKYLQYSQKTLERKLSKIRRQVFGEYDVAKQFAAWERDDFSPTSGHCEMIWAVKLSDYNEYRFLTTEEQKLFYSFISEMCASITPEQFQALALLKSYLVQHDISVEEYVDIENVCKLDFFEQCVKRFLVETGFQIARTTRHEVIKSMVRKFGKKIGYEFDI